MGLFKKQKQRERPVADTDKPRTYQAAPPGDPNLPGIAGYHGLGPLPKNAMPESRFNYRRPDGKG
jgi:hypothetical protein